MNKKLKQGLIYTSITAANVAILYVLKTAIFWEMLIYSIACSAIYYTTKEDDITIEAWKAHAEKIKTKYEAEKQDILNRTDSETKAEARKMAAAEEKAKKNYNIALDNKKMYETAQVEIVNLRSENSKLKTDLELTKKRINALLRKQAEQAETKEPKAESTQPAKLKLLIKD
ncbi:MAG: hypothetical protein ACYCSQ_05590 [bacterium]